MMSTTFVLYLMPLVMFFALVFWAYWRLTRTAPMPPSDDPNGGDRLAAPELSKFQLYRLNARRYAKWIRDRFKTSDRAGAMCWRKPYIREHKRARNGRLTAAQRRRAARRRMRAIRQSRDFILAMRAKGLRPVVVTARQLNRSKDPKFYPENKNVGRDAIRWVQEEAA